MAEIENRDLYRLPWSLPDNGISWLEPTAQCNLACDGCYRQNETNSHKSMEEVKAELDLFQSLRRSDCVSIAGGDPLMYPDIVPLVSDIKRRGLKPIINTNGAKLTRELLHDLKKAGVFGFTFHVDSRQGRGGQWRGKNELELNELRLQYAELLAAEGGIACSFNSTVYEDTLQHVPAMVQWAAEHINIVHTMVFIAFRHVVPQMPFDWYAGGEKVTWSDIAYHSDTKRKVDILSTDVLRKVREVHPEFTPSGFLNGTEKADSYKWLLAIRFGNRKRVFGYAGPKFLEAMMAGYHFARDRYLSYASPALMGMGKSALLLAPLDRGTRQAAKRYLGAALRNPLLLFRRLDIQTVMFIQPVDFLEDGTQVMCDSCPDITVHDGKLIWSCRLEERKAYGTWLRTVPVKN
jgi:hypothetical protein